MSLVLRLKKGDMLHFGGDDFPEVTLRVYMNPDKSLTVGLDAPDFIKFRHDKANDSLTNRKSQ